MNAIMMEELPRTDQVKRKSNLLHNVSQKDPHQCVRMRKTAFRPQTAAAWMSCSVLSGIEIVLTARPQYIQ